MARPAGRTASFCFALTQLVQMVCSTFLRKLQPLTVCLLLVRRRAGCSCELLAGEQTTYGGL